MTRLIVIVLFILLLAGNVYAVDITPPGGTIPGEPVKPWRQVTYCPLHMLEWSGE